MKTFFKVLWVISGIALILLGSYYIFSPAATLISISFIIGFVVLFNGIFALSHYFFIRPFTGSGWLLFDGIVGTLFGVLLLFTNLYTYLALIIPILFSIWIVVIGIFKICNSIHLKKSGYKNWYILTIIGALCALIGIAMWVEPILSAFTISIIVGICLIFAGISTISAFYLTNKVDKLS